MSLLTLLTDLMHRLRALFTRSREDRELDEELSFHLEMETEANVRRGMSPEEAARRARLRLGGPTQVREATQDARGVRWLEDFAADVRYALRGLRANPLFTTAIILTLGLGVGASAAMFSVVDALLLRPLPYDEPDRLVTVWTSDPETGSGQPYLDADRIRVWSEQDEIFEATFRRTRQTQLFTGGAEPVSLPVERVSPAFVETLGVRPVFGRGFGPADGIEGAEPVALISHGLWHSVYGGEPEAVGRTLELDGIHHTIIGVMPAAFKFPEYARTEAWVALRESDSSSRSVGMVGRLRGAASTEALQARANVLATTLTDDSPREGGWHVRLAPIGEGRGGDDDVRRSVGLLAGAVTFILLAATLNAINLLLVRGWSRTRELAVRIALGASRRRLVAQFLTESSALALMSGVAAVLLAVIVLRVMQGVLPGSFTFWTPYAFRVEQRTLLFTFGAAAGVGLVIGVLPAILSTRTAAVTASGALTPYAARTPARNRLRQALVITEVALSVTLLVGAGLLIQSFSNLNRVDPGFRLDDVAILTLDMSEHAYPDAQVRMAFLRRIEERIEMLPGVVGATTGGGGLPSGALTFTTAPETGEGPVSTDGEMLILPNTSVSPDFFELLDVQPLAGRVFTDVDAGTDHVLVSASLAHFLWGNESPIGQQFRPAPGWEWMTVVGVTGDLKLEGPNTPFGDRSFLTPASNTAAGYASIAVRTTDDPRPHFDAIRAVVHELDATQPIQSLRSAHDIYAETIDMPRFLLIVMATLAAIALLLAVVGVYGVLAFSVAQRRFDLGVRIALGAEPAALSRRVLGEGLGLAGLGVGLGLAGALALSGLIHGLLFDVEPGDPLTYGVVTAVSLLAAAAASWWPARRVGRIDPVAALEAE